METNRKGRNVSGAERTLAEYSVGDGRAYVWDMHVIKTDPFYPTVLTQADGLIKACMPENKDKEGRRDVKVDVLKV